MNIYTLFYPEWRIPNWYDTYDTIVVIAESEEEARKIHPNPALKWSEEKQQWYNPNAGSDPYWKGWGDDWGKPEELEVAFVGEAIEGLKPGVICTSFNRA